MVYSMPFQVPGAINTKATTPNVRGGFINRDQPKVTWSNTRYVLDALSVTLETVLLNDLLDTLPGAG